MARIKKNQRDEYIVIHHVRGEEDVLDFLRNTSHMILDRLCYQARLGEEAEFKYRNASYSITFLPDASFLIEAKSDSVSEVF